MSDKNSRLRCPECNYMVGGLDDIQAMADFGICSNCYRQERQNLGV